ncbi:surface protease GP63, partial [Trypanosoma cruzi]
MNVFFGFINAFLNSFFDSEDKYLCLGLWPLFYHGGDGDTNDPHNTRTHNAKEKKVRREVGDTATTKVVLANKNRWSAVCVCAAVICAAAPLSLVAAASLCPSALLLFLLFLPQTRPLLPRLIPLLPPAPQEQTHCPEAMRQPRRTVPLLMLLPWLMTVLCCTGVCVAADPAVKHRCGFDAMMKKYGRLPTAVVREVPRRGQGAVQAYTAASEDGDDGWA